MCPTHPENNDVSMLIDLWSVGIRKKIIDIIIITITTQKIKNILYEWKYR